MTGVRASSLRVLIVGVDWPPETFLWRLIRGLAAAGMHLTLAVPESPRNAQPFPNCDLLVTGGWSETAFRRVWRSGGRLAGALSRSPLDVRRTFAAAVAAGAGSGGPERLFRWLPFAGRAWDVIYFPWNLTAISHLPLMDRAPSVVSCRGAQINVAPYNWKRAGLRQGLMTTFERSAAVHCVSEAIREEATRFGLDRAKAVVIRPGVDPSYFRPRPNGHLQTGPLRVITTGTIMWRKGYEYALTAVRMLLDRGLPVRFDVIGDGPEVQRLLYTVNDLRLADHVFWHGRLSPAEVRARLQAADVFLLSSLSEGISNAVLEAMACGLPVVTTAAGGMAEAVTDGVEGFVVPGRDPESIAVALRELDRRPEQRISMGVAGRERVQRDFRLEGQVESFVRLFQEVA